MAEATATKDPLQKTLESVITTIDELILKLPPVAKGQCWTPLFMVLRYALRFYSFRSVGRYGHFL